MTVTTINDLGPIDDLIVQFPAGTLTGEIAEEARPQSASSTAEDPV